MSNDHVKLVVAREHGLDSRHMPWLTGETLSEVEESAARLRDLLGEHESHEPEPTAAPATDLFTAYAETKATRQRALRAVLIGRSPSRSCATRAGAS